MNAVEIEEAVSELASAPLDRDEFPYAFLQAFGNKETTLRKLRSGASNKSDLGGVLQHGNIHILVTATGEVGRGLNALRVSPATSKSKAKFILATDGADFEAEDRETGETAACAYQDFPDHFGFFLPLAGITTVKQIRESSFDIRATGRLNQLYVQLLKDNPDWGASDRRPDMNHFMARLIFCFFAEDTDIFHPSYRFTATVEKMSERDASNTHEVIGELFRAMNTPTKHEGQLDDRYRLGAKIPRWADPFPYVNGELFSGGIEVPRFSRIARSYLLHIGSLDWTKINPDIFGSMIQAVADDEERGALGMHYTSVPNILKVLNPLFLDDLRAQLEEAGDNARKLINLRNRIAKIRVFDPACGSGNFLVIAYKGMRAIEAEINRRREEADRPSDIPLTNFRGIELRDFPAEIARLALIIAEFQCDVLYRGQQLALAEFLPLDNENWITCGNALRLNWLSISPSSGTGVKLTSDDLFETPLTQAEIDFQNQGGETYVCGNPPYKGSQDQSPDLKSDLRAAFAGTSLNPGSADYILGWFVKAKEYISATGAAVAFVTTNSVHQGRVVGRFWPHLLSDGIEIFFAEPSFLWSNLAIGKAAVTVSIIGLRPSGRGKKLIFDKGVLTETSLIGPYLVPGHDEVVFKSRSPLSTLPKMVFGSMPNDGGHLLLDVDEADSLADEIGYRPKYIRPFVGTSELTSGEWRRCLWFPTETAPKGELPERVIDRIKEVQKQREESTRPTTKKLSCVPHRFGEVRQEDGERTIVVGGVSTESRKILPADLVSGDVIVSNLAYAIFNAPLWCFSIVTSSLHRAWIATVCGKMRIHYRYSNTLGWNTFPLPKLTEKNVSDLEKSAEDILLARKSEFPANITDLYDPKVMPTTLRDAHDRNDEVLERIYIGRRFRNDTERLEKLFDLYTKMTARSDPAVKRPVKVSA